MTKENDITDKGAIAPPAEDKKVAKERPAKQVGAAEAVYSAAELANAAQQQFNVLPEVAAAALKLAKRDQATIAEAGKIIREFLKRAVK